MPSFKNMIKPLQIVSDDQRRTLYEFGHGKWKVAKYLIIKEDCKIGGHYHNNKDECFLILSGQATININHEKYTLYAPFTVDVSRGTFHEFEVKAGSQLICLASEEHDPNDDLVIN